MATTLLLTVVWQDVELIELRVAAANDSFGGVTEGYFTRPALLELAEFLSLFPRNNSEQFELHSTEQAPAVQLRFYCIDGAGHTAAKALLRKKLASNSRPNESASVELELMLAGALVGEFAASLRELVQRGAGEASLFPPAP
jgi:hypothetical protein